MPSTPAISQLTLSLFDSTALSGGLTLRIHPALRLAVARALLLIARCLFPSFQLADPKPSLFRRLLIWRIAIGVGEPARGYPGAQVFPMKASHAFGPQHRCMVVVEIPKQG